MKPGEHLRITKRAVKMCFQLDERFTVSLILESVLTAGVGYIPVCYSAKVIDALYGRASAAVIAGYVGLAVGLVFLVELIKHYMASVREVANHAIYRSGEWMYSEKAMSMAYESIEDPEVTRLLYRVRMESQTGHNQFHLHVFIEEFCRSLTGIIASVSLTASFFALPSVPFYWKAGIVAGLFLTVTVSGLSALKINRMENDFWAASVDMNVMSQQFQEYVEDYNAGKDIRLYDMGDYLAEERARRSEDYNRMYVRNSCRQALWTIPGTLLENLFQFGMYAVLICAALEGGITVGSIAKYVSCMMLLTKAAVDMVGTILNAADNNRYLKRFFTYFDIPNHMYKGSLTVEKRDDNQYDVEFRDVSFRYPNTKAYALRHVNLKFRVGERLAIVGRNGSGKTTFIKLLCRLYDPSEGEILLNGVNIQKYDYDEYMSIFSVVFQDFKLFAFKLGEVVASDRRFDRDRVRDCLVKANFGDRYEELPEGADTCLYRDYDKSGIEISGGEAQKIALARALYRDAPFILLDEPTAALDPVSEYEVYSNFNAISGDKTAVYISHRMASCRFCDKIAVFDKGEIVQTGTHEELLGEEGGVYGELWQAQAQYYTRGE